MRRTAAVLLLLLSGHLARAAEPSPCPASAQPGWASLSAAEKRERVRACRPEEPAPEPVSQPVAAVEPPPAPAESLGRRLAPGARPSRVTRVVFMSLGGALSSGIVGTFVGLTATRPQAQPAMLIAVGLGALSTGLLVHGIGAGMKGEGQLGGALLGALAGSVVGFLGAIGVQAVAPVSPSYYWEPFHPAVLGVVIGGIVSSVVFTTLGAVLGWELTTPPPLSLSVAPTGGGASAVITGAW